MMPIDVPWDLLVTVIVAVIGSSWFSSLIVNRRAKSDEIIQMIKELREDMEEARAISARIRILRCNDEILRGATHSKESLDQTLEDIDLYETYCNEHPKFKNNKTVMSAGNIKSRYQELMDELRNN